MLDLERAWGREPGWFGTLDRETQVLVWAHHQLRAEQQRGQK